jgi:aspartyl-tRNA(Asn)/glutamyl-tRNA(Gln) amidotransferase subunit A
VRGANAFPTLAEASRAIGEGALSPVALTEMLLDRIAALNPMLKAFITVTGESALAEARAAEAEIRAGRRRGPLHGVPIAYKDIFETAGVRTSAHSRALENHVPARDATSVSKMKAAGAISLGKLATHEFAFGGPSFDLPWPPARNPWNTDYFTGGSSSGTGAAVTAGLALGGFGSDTGGSIRLPAAFSGLVGLKPTYGRVSRSGVFPLAFSLDHAGPMAWTAEDCALMLDAMAGFDPADPASADVPMEPYGSLLDRDLSGLRIGVIRHFWEEAEADSDTVAALEAAVETFRGLGAEISEVRLSPLRDYGAAGMLILLSEAFAVHEETLIERPTDLGEIMRTRMFLAGAITAADYVQAMRRRRELCAEMAAAFGDVDLMMTASAPGPAPRIDAMTTFATFERPLLTMPFNVTGHPAIATRAGFAANGLPLSLQLVGRPFAEATVLAAAHAYEHATDWAARRPALEPADAAA